MSKSFYSPYFFPGPLHAAPSCCMLMALATPLSTPRSCWAFSATENSMLNTILIPHADRVTNHLTPHHVHS